MQTPGKEALFVLSNGPGKMKRLADERLITTFAGLGTPGHTGDGGPAERAQLNNPYTCAFDKQGALIVAESGGNVVRRIAPKTRLISTVAGSGEKGFSGDGGPAVEASFNDLVCCAVEPRSGDLIIVDRLNARIRRVQARAGIISTIAGTGVRGGTGNVEEAVKAQLRDPHDLVVDTFDSFLICDVGDCRIRRWSAGILHPYAGTGKRAHTGDNGPVLQADFAAPRALALDKDRNILYVCEREGNTIRRIDRATGIVTPYAGTGAKGYTGDGGLAKEATFNGPKGLAIDRDGSLLVVDTENHAIRRIDFRTGIISTVAGGHRGPDGDNGPATQAGLNRPHGVTVGPDGALYIGDSENHRIRRVAPAKR